jgi:elongation factor Ts
MPGTQISAQQVKELRAETGAGMMDCKRVLEEAGGDLEKAARLLREKGLASAKKRQEKVAEQGVIEVYTHIGQQIGSMVELNCETDFVARNSEFLELAHLVALQVAAMNPQYLERESVPDEAVAGKKAVFKEMCETEGKPEKSWDNIINGKLEKYFQEVCLLEQPFVKDPSITVGELVVQAAARLGEKVAVRRFTRFQVGADEE